MRAFSPVGACRSNPVIDLAFAIMRSLFRQTSSNLLYQQILIKFLLKERFQHLLILLTVVAEPINEPLHTCLLLARQMLSLLLKILDHHVSIACFAQDIGNLFDTSVRFFEGPRLTCRLKSV